MFFSQFRVHRKRNDFLTGTLSFDESISTAETVSIRLEMVQGRRVVDRGGDFPRFQKGGEGISSFSVSTTETDRVLVKHVGGVFGDDRRDNLRHPCEELIVTLGGRLPGVGERVQISEFDSENRRLNGVEATVQADLFVPILLTGSVVSQLRHPLVHGRIVRQNSAAVSVTTQILGREEGQRADATDVPHGTFAVSGSYSLGSILYDRDAVTLCQLHDSIHVCRLTVEVDRNNGDRPIRNQRRGVFDVDVERLGVNFCEYGLSTQKCDHFSSRNERKSGRYDLVARTDTESHQGDLQRVGAVGYTKSVVSAQMRGEFFFECSNDGSLDETRAREHVSYCLIYLPLDS